jgi:hypothetical protein
VLLSRLVFDVISHLCVGVCHVSFLFYHCCFCYQVGLFHLHFFYLLFWLLYCVLCFALYAWLFKFRLFVLFALLVADAAFFVCFYSWSCSVMFYSCYFFFACLSFYLLLSACDTSFYCMLLFNVFLSSAVSIVVMDMCAI